MFKSSTFTGIGAPAIAGLDEGCFVVFPVEEKDRWCLDYAFVNAPPPGNFSSKRIESGGTANISPVAAVVDNRVCVLWESNAPGRRGILSCWVDEHGAGERFQLSAPEVNSYNPSVVALEDGTLFAAWDSARDESIDIYGAAWKEGQWQPERRLTSDA